MHLLSFVNRPFKKVCTLSDCTFIVADRGAGKSCLLSLIFEEYKKLGYECYCNYPYKGVNKLPYTYKTVKVGKTSYKDKNRLVLDKEWLYSHDFQHCVIGLDEAKTIYPARGWESWSELDSEFFNFIRKNDIKLFIITQSYDEIDLNVRRACDECWYLINNNRFNMTTIERSKQTQAKVIDKTKELTGTLYRKGAQKISWEIVEIPLGVYRFYRKPYYNNYFTNIVISANKSFVVPEPWEETDNPVFWINE